MELNLQLKGFQKKFNPKIWQNILNKILSFLKVNMTKLSVKTYL